MKLADTFCINDKTAKYQAFWQHWTRTTRFVPFENGTRRVLPFFPPGNGFLTARGDREQTYYYCIGSSRRLGTTDQQRMSDFDSCVPRRLFIHTCSETKLLTGQPDRMSHRKWRETKQQPSIARSGHQLSCCLVMNHEPGGFG